MALTDYFQYLPEEFSDSIVFNTQVSTFDTGKEQRRSQWASNKRTMSFTYPNAFDSQIDDLYDFFLARQGSFDLFFCIIPERYEQTEQMTGGTQITLDLTKPSPDNIIIFLDGTQVWNFSYSESTNMITFDVATTGEVIIRQYNMILCRFADDVMSRSFFVESVVSQGLDFITV